MDQNSQGRGSCVGVRASASRPSFTARALSNSGSRLGCRTRRNSQRQRPSRTHEAIKQARDAPQHLLERRGEGKVPAGDVHPGKQQRRRARAVLLGANQVIYLNSVTLTWFRDVNIPEQWGFLRNQVTPFVLPTPDGEQLHAWHVLPLGLYQQHEGRLTREPAGLAHDISQRTCFKLLKDDPDSLLVLYFHGAAGTLGSGWRPPSYRAMSAASPGRIHTIAIDYRGFGSSSGRPSEAGLLTDALALANFALREAGIPPSRIVLFAQSLGTAVAISLAHHFATQPDTILFAGLVLVAPFGNVELLTASYRVAGTIPLLSPLARFPRLMAFFNTFVRDKWPSTDRLAALVRHVEHLPPGGRDAARYHVTVIHAEDDYDIPWSHSENLFWHAVNATSPVGTTRAELDRHRADAGQLLGHAGRVVDWRAPRGHMREIILRYGLHDRIMAYPVVSLAVLRAFQSKA
ncbi:abhydrolase domain-containing protein 12B [Lasiosphaeria miniovina]|uniref:Abhydrolase domain-containing protein 12B n=1 Tax=Lasiosphaeria miniovina TaxID=1954250 RepID=A0AA40E4B5_9PEZI|nr:abhydrolase domain-containing protein 12B [Lasiosphaeria miniovina]KAK0723531.1 abhydrolase domain-containing protein 12B [Lasiosphaeria miniovina]